MFNKDLRKNEYRNIHRDKSSLHEIDPPLSNLQERIIKQVQVSPVSTDENTKDITARRTFVSTDRHTSATAETLAEKFMIGTKQARATLDSTMQRGTKSAILPISRRYRADRMFNVPRLHAKIATDTIFVKKTSLRNNIVS